MLPFITVVMPIRNEVRFIRDTLGQLLAQDYPADRYEIIVADGMSDDGTQDIVREIAVNNPQVCLIENQKRLSSAGRNVGFKNGRGDYFLVVDGHCFIPDTNLLKNVADCFAESGADCLCRPQPLDPPGLTHFQQAVAMARGSRLGHGGDSLIFSDFEGYCSPVSSGSAYSKAVFEKIGYVDESFDAAEDVEFNYRVEQAGFKSYTSPRLKIRYYPRESALGLFRQTRRYGKGRRRFIRKHKNAVTVNQLVPSAFVGGLLALVMLGLSTLIIISLYPFFLIASGIYILYVFIVMAQSLFIAIQRGNRFFWSLPVIFLMVHSGLGVGFIQETFNFRRKE